MLHREKALRARMRWVAIVFGLMLIAMVVGVVEYVQRSRPSQAEVIKPIRK